MNNELKRWALAQAEELRKQGKNPHGALRDLLIEIALDEQGE